MIRALDIANYVISKCAEEREPVSNLQLQGILYIVQKTFLNIGMRAFEDDFEAWQIGPVVREVYNQYCGFGALKIRLSYPGILPSEGFRVIADPIIVAERQKMPWELAAMVQDGAWSDTYDDGKGSHRVIPESMIRNADSPFWGSSLDDQ